MIVKEEMYHFTSRRTCQ